MADNKVNSGLLEFSEDQKVFVALDAETSEVQKAVTIDGDGVETDITGVDVTVEALSVTENGTYSEEGKAYSPVTVNVEGVELSNDLQTVTIPALTLTGEYSDDLGVYMTSTKLADAVLGVSPSIDYDSSNVYIWFVRNNEGAFSPGYYKQIDGVDVAIYVDDNTHEISLETMSPEAYTIQVPSDTVVFYIANADLIYLYGTTPFCDTK